MMTLFYGNDQYMFRMTGDNPVSDDGSPIEGVKESIFNARHHDPLCRLAIEPLSLPYVRDRVNLPLEVPDGQALILTGDLALSVFLTVADYYG